MKKKVLYLECASGISGDMTVAALLDLGANKVKLQHAISSLKIDGYSLSITRKELNGIDACSFDVTLQEEKLPKKYVVEENVLRREEENDEDVHSEENEKSEEENTHHHHHHHHHHSLSYYLVHPMRLFRHHHHHHHRSSKKQDTLDISEDRVQTGITLIRTHHHHHHHHHHGNDSHAERNLEDVLKIIRSGNLTPKAEKIAIRIFEIVAEAEAKAHGTTIEEVHFHEVGAIDSIIDIVSAAVCLDDLDITDVCIPVINEGSGLVTCRHGELSVPVPAVSMIAETYSMNLQLHSEIDGEMVTPTGIAIAAAIRTSETLPQKFSVERTGFGAGKRDFKKITNILKASIISFDDGSGVSAESVPAAASESSEKSLSRSPTTKDDSDGEMIMLETNIDDMTGEESSLAMEALFDAGAVDVLFIPAYMKKNRPASILRAICLKENEKKVMGAIFRSTPTLGIRRTKLDRVCLQRFCIQVSLPVGTVQVKCARFEDEIFTHPEYEDVKKLSASSGIPFRDLYHDAERAACQQIHDAE